MITHEEYTLAKRANALLFQGTRDDDILSQDLIVIIEALRNVARAALQLNYIVTAYQDNIGPVGEVFWNEKTKQALDALPAWLLEDE